MTTIIHKANQGARKMQLLTFFANLDRKPNGLLTAEARKKRDGFLSAFGITAERARQIMNGSE